MVQNIHPRVVIWIPSSRLMWADQLKEIDSSYVRILRSPCANKVQKQEIKVWRKWAYIKEREKKVHILALYFCAFMSSETQSIFRPYMHQWREGSKVIVHYSLDATNELLKRINPYYKYFWLVGSWEVIKNRYQIFMSNLQFNSVQKAPKS